jgi:hypothetical protein
MSLVLSSIGDSGQGDHGSVKRGEEASFLDGGSERVPLAVLIARSLSSHNVALTRLELQVQVESSLTWWSFTAPH